MINKIGLGRLTAVADLCVKVIMEVMEGENMRFKIDKKDFN